VSDDSKLGGSVVKNIILDRTIAFGQSVGLDGQKADPWTARDSEILESRAVPCQF